jgi:hypothetical protein
MTAAQWGALIPALVAFLVAITNSIANSGTKKRLNGHVLWVHDRLHELETGLAALTPVLTPKTESTAAPAGSQEDHEPA